MSLERFTNGVLRERWDDVTRMYTSWNQSGTQTVSRAYNATEILQADNNAARTAEWQQIEKDTQAERALIAASIALQPAPTVGGAWVQPTGVANAYAKDSVVTHGGKTWISLTPFNVWAPGVAGWREQTTGGAYPAWVQPVGSVDAYKLNSKVSHNGKNWNNTVSDANVWEPGVFGWVEIA